MSTSDTLMQDAMPPKWLWHTAHMIKYNPEQELSYFVRLLGFGRTTFDRREHSNREDPTRDAVGAGKTLIQACARASLAQAAQGYEKL